MCNHSYREERKKIPWPVIVMSKSFFFLETRQSVIMGLHSLSCLYFEIHSRVEAEMKQMPQ